jgi:hypothetical protein
VHLVHVCAMTSEALLDAVFAQLVDVIEAPGLDAVFGLFAHGEDSTPRRVTRHSSPTARLNALGDRCSSRSCANAQS